MTATGSPVIGESIEHRGRKAVVVELDLEGRHTQETFGIEWDMIPSPVGPSRYVDYLPEESGAEEVPEPEEEPAPAVAEEATAVPASTPETPAPRRANGVPRKLVYAEALAAGRDDLTDAEYRLLMAMWQYANNTTLGDIFPGHARLAEQVGLTRTKNNRDSVGRRIGSLIRKGYVVKVREGAAVPHRRAAEYRLTLPEWEGATTSTAVSGTP